MSVTGCSDAACGQRAAHSCALVDRYGHLCATPWCSRHSVAVGRHRLCPAHGAILLALHEADAPGDASSIGLSSVAPQVILAIAIAADADMTAIVTSVGGGLGDARLVRWRLMARMLPRREHAWHASWRVLEAAGPRATTSLLLAEGDGVVTVTVNGAAMGRLDLGSMLREAEANPCRLPTTPEPLRAAVVGAVRNAFGPSVPIAMELRGSPSRPVEGARP